MADPNRGTRARRVHRRPGWALLTTLLVLAIVASSALVFTDRVQLLKLAVILALWAAVVAAFVSFIYRRQSDVDSAKARDLKLVYDLQLDREIAARREYELGVEAHLRRELSSELSAQASDEVASLRAELAALRANLEILFDTDLRHRPAIETDATSVHGFGDWDAVGDGAEEQSRDRGYSPGRVISSRVDTDDRDDGDPNTEESPIIDVPEEPHPPEYDRVPEPTAGGAHRTPPESPAARAPEPHPPRPEPGPAPAPPATEPEIRYPWLVPQEAPPAPPPPTAPPPTAPPPAQPVAPRPAARSPWQEPERRGRHTTAAGTEWHPAPARGDFIPAGAPGSNWVASTPGGPTENGPPPTMAPPPTDSGSARHSTSEPSDAPRPPRHTAQPDPGEQSRAARHRGPEESTESPEPDSGGQHVGGQPISELLARLQAGATGGGRRRRRGE